MALSTTETKLLLQLASIRLLSQSQATTTLQHQYIKLILTAQSMLRLT